MLQVTKFENINESFIMLGALAIRELKKKSHTIESLFKILTQKSVLSPDKYILLLTFLYAAGIINIIEKQIILVYAHVSK